MLVDFILSRSINAHTWFRERWKLFSLGAFFISFENLKQRWLKTASQNIDELEIDSSIKKGFSIDKDCFGKDPINAINLKDDILFIDIGVPSDLEKGKDVIPKIIGDNKNEDQIKIFS